MADEKKQTTIPEEVLGLDNEEKNARVYFRHVTGTNVFSVSEQASTISKFLTSAMDDGNDINGRSKDQPLVLTVDHGSDENFAFIQRYMEYFEDKVESDPPPKPLPNNTHISAIFQDEYKIFSDIVKENDTLKVKLETLNKYIIVALYFDIKKLSTKLAAIIASLIQPKSLTQLKNLLGSSK
jgi:hypothetical protein